LEYKKRGYELVAANFFNKKGLRKGEIDVIVKNKELIIFIEVKTRSQNYGRYGTAVESVSVYKQAKLLTALKLFLLRNQKFAALRPQVDVCAIIIHNVDNLILAQDKPKKYLSPHNSDPVSYLAHKTHIDKPLYSVTIIANGVEDAN